MPDSSDDIFDGIFDGHVEFDPRAPLEPLLSKLPGRWCVYCFADADRRPVQLLCVKNLRASVKRRLGLSEARDEPTRRIDYREVVRHVFYRRVDGALEQDLLYQDAARALFPGQYRALVPERPAWFVHVDPDAPHPRFRAVSDPREPRGRLFGPLAEKQDATALVESLEDLFDLCRYHHLLVQSPAARACPYKDMGRCPAPCDGSMTLDAYCALVRLAISFLDDPQTAIRQHEQRMRQAAAALLFEQAGSVRKLVEEMKALTRGSYRLLRAMESFAFVALQRGSRAKTAKVFLVTPGACEQVLSLSGRGKDAVGELGEVLGSLRTLSERLPRVARDARSVERLACVAQHMLGGKSPAVFVPLAGCDERSLGAALRELARAPCEPEPAPDEEGVVREGAAG